MAHDPGLEDRQRALVHIGKAMALKNIRHRRKMPPLLLMVRNISTPEDVIENSREPEELLKEILSESHH